MITNKTKPDKINRNSSDLAELIYPLIKAIRYEKAWEPVCSFNHPAPGGESEVWGTSLHEVAREQHTQNAFVLPGMGAQGPVILWGAEVAFREAQ